MLSASSVNELETVMELAEFPGHYARNPGIGDKEFKDILWEHGISTTLKVIREYRKWA
jgi:hypothetical protein